ncbi:Ppx/GppA phosphatase family protein [Mitsuokella multacida]|uniref:Ppx/GppA phosphatase family protein n=1 Tax=Mitsuokella multacida TaxID=52226 RepID=UPI002671E33D|nr:phosphatase [Mitsuokella multacida]
MKKTSTFGIIHIGSIHTSMAIVKYHSPTQIEVIDSANKELPLGEEVFRTHRLSFASIHALSTILQGFRQLLLDYRVSEVYPIATTVVREAENRLGILDLLYMRTGFRFHVADMTEEVYYKFFALHHFLKKNAQVGTKPTLLLDVTSGGLGFTGWQDGTLLFQTNVTGGRLSVLEHFTEEERVNVMFPSAVRDYLHASLSSLWPRIEHADIHTLVLTGFEARILVSHLLGSAAEYPAVIAPEEFLQIMESLMPLTAHKLMQVFDISERRAQLLLPTLLLYEEVVRTLNIDTILVMNTTFLYGYAAWCGAQRISPSAISEQADLLLDLARSTAMRYNCNLPHISRIDEYATKLFDGLRRIHGLSTRHRLLLRMSALLHETGKFVNLRNYPLHSWQIIMGTDIFGITDAEKEVIACISYYYHRDNPGKKDVHYQRLTQDQKIIADKCCAILRLADALDQGHSGRIQDLSVRLVKEKLYVNYTSEYDISLIRWSFAQASVLFREIFGIEPVLRRK